MKRIILILLCLVNSNFIFASQPSRIADSMAKAYVSRLRSTSSKLKLNRLLSARSSTELSLRMDTIQYNYAYIVEHYNDTDASITCIEFYFNTQPKGMYKNNFEDSCLFADLVFSNNKLLDQRYMFYSSSTAGIIFSGKYEYYYSLDSILLRSNKMRSVQELSYDKTPPYSAIKRSVYDKADTSTTLKVQFEKKYINALKSSHQIVSFVDRLSDKVIVSIQTPCHSPHVNAYPFAFAGYDW